MDVAPAPSTRPALAYHAWRGAEGPRAPGHCLALHGAGGGALQLVPLCQAIRPHFDGLALQGPRPRNALASGAAPAGTYGGYLWFRETADGQVEPASFGDSLAQAALHLERAGAHHGTRALVVGLGQGALLARALVAVAPERVAAAVVLRESAPAAAAAGPVRRTMVALGLEPEPESGSGLGGAPCLEIETPWSPRDPLGPVREIRQRLGAIRPRPA